MTKNLATKKALLIKLLNGQISIKDVPPKLVIHFKNYLEDSYLINGKIVDKQTFYNLLDKQPAICDLTTYGRKDDTAEFYH